MEYGRFSQEGNEYVIYNPDTKEVWQNYLFNKDYYMKVSQAGMGSSYCLKPMDRDFTRGYRYFYLMDRSTNQCWNPNYQPLRTKLDFYTCTHGMGYTVFDAERDHIACRITVFVPLSDMCEVWKIEISNQSEEEHEIELYSVIPFEGNGMGVDTRYHKDGNFISSYLYPYYIRYEDKCKSDEIYKSIFMFSTLKPNGYECNEKYFFGSADLTSVPEAVKTGRLENRDSMADAGMAGIFQHVLKLKPNETFKTSIVVGCTKEIEDIPEVRKRYTEEAVEAAFRAVNDEWRKFSDIIKVRTPDEKLNRFINFWLKKQTYAMACCHRFSNLSCIRNELQDAMAVSMFSPEKSEEIFLRVLKDQESSGYIKQWHMIDPIQGEYGLALLDHVDGAIWLVSCICEMIQQTGNMDFLNIKLHYKDNDTEEPIYQHLVRAILYLNDIRGVHGLCLFKDGDWCDPMNGMCREGRGESVWASLGVCYAINQLLPFCELLNREEDQRILQAVYDSYAEAIQESGFVGDRYIIGYDDNGNPQGTSENEEGQLYLNNQTWAIMSGVAGNNAQQCLKNIDSLDTVHGPVVLKPPFTKWNPFVGKLSNKLAGTSENGAIYCHGSMFKAYADCLMGRGNKAYETISKTLPENNDPDQLPVFLPNYYFGLSDKPEFGRSSQNYSTGACAWMLWVCVEFLLGIRSTVVGLALNPVIPDIWKEFEAVRQYRDAVYHIKVINKRHIEHSKKMTVYVNGVLYDRKILPHEPGKNYDVVAVME